MNYKYSGNRLKSRIEEELILLSEAAKRYGYSEKHLNLLARTGRIKAYKERRNWVTTAKSIEEYIKGGEISQ